MMPVLAFLLSQSYGWMPTSSSRESCTFEVSRGIGCEKYEVLVINANNIDNHLH
jgi:hypothetical protein